jgi:hypothetical protein
MKLLGGGVHSGRLAAGTGNKAGAISINDDDTNYRAVQSGLELIRNEQGSTERFQTATPTQCESEFDVVGDG